MENEGACQYTYSELASLIKGMGKRIRHFGPHSADSVRAIEMMFEVLLPPDYRQFICNFGALVADGVAIIGLVKSEQGGLQLDEALLMLRLAHPDIPTEIIPIEDLGDGGFACLACTGKKNDDTPVVVINIAQPQSLDALPVIAPCFREYLYNRLVLLQPIQEAKVEAPQPQLHPLPQHKTHGLRILERHVRDYQQQFEYDHATGGKLPRNHDWRPYRYCIQDVLFGTVVVRHERETNCLEIDVFLTAHIPEYDELAGARALTTFLLSEAYKCGGTMELRFTKEVEGGQVPTELQALARRYDIRFRDSARGRVTSDEAKALYAALTGFSLALQQQINALERAGRIKMARACYAIHHGIWSREQVEMIALGSQRPDSVLAGLAQPHQRHLYAHDLMHARAALLGGMLDRQLARRERRDANGTPYDLEDDVRSLEVGFDGDYYAKIYRIDEPIALPWLHGGRVIKIQAENQFYVLVRARDVADMALHLVSDLQLAEQLRNQTGNPVFILVPNDFTALPEAFAQQILSQSEALKIRLMICPEPILTFDTDAGQQLARSRILRK